MISSKFILALTFEDAQFEAVLAGVNHKILNTRGLALRWQHCLGKV
jgi:hypothetical protein